MSSLMRLILGVLFLTFSGWNALCLMPRRKEPLYLFEALAISFGLGVGLVSLEMFIFYLLGIKFDLLSISAPWLILMAFNLLTRRVYRLNPIPAEGKGPGVLENIFVLGISIEVFYAFFRALIKPIESYDAIAIYAIKSKIFYLAGTIPREYFGCLAGIFPHPDYPLNIPLAETFFYLIFGQLNDQLVKIIFPIFYLGILSLAYWAIRRFASRLHALIFTFMLATIPQFSAYATNAYLDLILSFYYFASALLLLRWLLDRDDTASLVLSALMAALAAWTKNEGIMYCAINVFLMCVFVFTGRKPARKRGAVAVLVYAGILLAINLPWLLIKAAAHITNTDVDVMNIDPVNFVKQIYKITPILYEFQKEFFNPKKWLIVWPAAVAVFILNYKKAFAGTARRFTALSVILAVLGYMWFYMISNLDVRFFAGKTWARFLIHFLPMVVYWMALVACGDDKDIEADE